MIGESAQRLSEKISVLQAGNRLEITAKVDAAGLAKLKEALGGDEEILNLLQ